MKEQLISFETAKLAKEKGFDWKHSDFYIDKRNNDYEATPQSLLQKWLREEHEVHIVVHPIDDLTEWIFMIDASTPTAFERLYNSGDSELFYSTYEEALEKGLQQALKLIP